VLPVEVFVFRSGTKRGQFRNDAGRTSLLMAAPGILHSVWCCAWIRRKSSTRLVEAKRDKRAFLRAVGMELDALGAQLDARCLM